MKLAGVNLVSTAPEAPDLRRPFRFEPGCRFDFNVHNFLFTRPRGRACVYIRDPALSLYASNVAIVMP